MQPFPHQQQLLHLLLLLRLLSLSLSVKRIDDDFRELKTFAAATLSDFMLEADANGGQVS